MHALIITEITAVHDLYTDSSSKYYYKSNEKLNMIDNFKQLLEHFDKFTDLNPLNKDELRCNI